MPQPCIAAGKKSKRLSSVEQEGDGSRHLKENLGTTTDSTRVYSVLASCGRFWNYIQFIDSTEP